MNRNLAIAACLLVLPGAALAATKTYDFGRFEGVAVSAGIKADIKMGSPQSVVAETDGSNFDDLVIGVDGNVLHIGRPPGNWLLGKHPDYQVHITVLVLHSLAASSSGEARVDGTAEGDFALTASSSGKVELPALKAGSVSIAASSSGRVRLSALEGGNVTMHASSGGSIDVAGSCASLNVSASSGGDARAGALKCENVTANASSSGAVSAFASKIVQGHASSGGDIKIEGKPPVVQVSESSGGDVSVAK